MSDPREELARLLRQQREMGGSRLFLDGMSRQEALRLARTAAARPGSRPPREGRAKMEPTARGGPAAAPSAVGGGEEGATELSVLPNSYEEVRRIALGCTRCRLAETRTQVVFSDGSPTARLVVVGEAPGANEDATGLPFVGAAGKFLDLLLATVDLSRRDSVYICNVLKCRPPANRNPMQDEIEACSPFLLKQLELISPRALLAVGTFAGKLLTARDKPLGQLRGDVHSYRGIPLVVTYHPAALLRNPGWTRAFWDDLQLLRQVMD